jgi:hypothetical protein
VICNKKPGRATVYFWLCEQCCSQFHSSVHGECRCHTRT